MNNIKEPPLGTWAFLKTGWWVLHVVSIIAVGYLGYYILRAM